MTTNTIHIIHELAIFCLIPWIQEFVYLYMLIVVTCLILSVWRGNLQMSLYFKYINGNSYVHPFIYSLCQEWTFLWNYQIIRSSCWCLQHVSYSVWLWELEPHFRSQLRCMHFLVVKVTRFNSLLLSCRLLYCVLVYLWLLARFLWRRSEYIIFTQMLWKFEKWWVSKAIYLFVYA